MLKLCRGWGGWGGERAKQTSPHRVVRSRHKADSAAHSDLSSVHHRLHLTISKASGQEKKENKTPTYTHTHKTHHKNTCFITSVFLYLWLMNLKLCVLISQCTLPRVNQPRVKCRRKTPQITERTEKLHAYCTLQKEEQFQLAFPLVLPPRKPVFEQI